MAKGTWNMTRSTFSICSLPVLISMEMLAAHMETVRNAKVVVTEETLQPGQSEGAASQTPSLTVYLTEGAIQVARTDRLNAIKGEVLFRPAGVVLKNAGPSVLQAVRIDFLGGGDPSSNWGNTGLSPNYKVIFENQYVRAYDIRIPAG